MGFLLILLNELAAQARQRRGRRPQALETCVLGMHSGLLHDCSRKLRVGYSISLSVKS